jgi:hypothetical protein
MSVSHTTDAYDYSAGAQDADLGGLKLLRVDGGATRSDLLMQLQVGQGRGLLTTLAYLRGLGAICATTSVRAAE